MDLPRMDAQISRGDRIEPCNSEMELQVQKTQKQSPRAQGGRTTREMSLGCLQVCLGEHPRQHTARLELQKAHVHGVCLWGAGYTEACVPGQVHGFTRMLAAEPCSEYLVKRPPECR